MKTDFNLIMQGMRKSEYSLKHVLSKHIGKFSFLTTTINRHDMFSCFVFGALTLIGNEFVFFGRGQ